MAAMFWRRLDLPGHDACRLVGDGLEGMALWREGRTVAIRYRVTVDADWRTRQVRLEGSDGDTPVDIDLVSDGGAWTLNGQAQPDVAGLIDIDLGFTPATNTVAIRRLLAEGAPVDAGVGLTAAWIDPDDWTLKPLPQRYTRLAPDRWLYQSDNGSGFRAEVGVTADGLVTEYEGLWTEETQRGS